MMMVSAHVGIGEPVEVRAERNRYPSLVYQIHPTASRRSTTMPSVVTCIIDMEVGSTTIPGYVTSVWERN